MEGCVQGGLRENLRSAFLLPSALKQLLWESLTDNCLSIDTDKTSKYWTFAEFLLIESVECKALCKKSC